ncbi:MAG: helix-turn-helix domain-containing protein [Acinetobacter sp.]
MGSVLNSAECRFALSCNQDLTEGSTENISGEGVLVSHLYVANTTLVKLNKGVLTIKSEHNEEIKCSGEGLILIEKNQTISILCNDYDNHLDIKSIDISYDLMRKMYSLFITENKLVNMTSPQKYKTSRMLCSDLRPGMGEAFDNVFNCVEKMQRCECGDCTKCQTGDERSPLDFTLMFLLSAFTAQDDGLAILSRAVQSSIREKTFNMIRNEPSKIWSLDDVAANMYMSRSTLKRKLAIEGTTFSEIYLDVRMSLAARLLRAGEHNITQVSVMCGYNRPSYFITTFKRYFQMTPNTFMKLANH